MDRILWLMPLLAAAACGIADTDGGARTDSADDIEARYRQIVLAAGGSLNPGGSLTVLGLRGLARDGSIHDIAAEPVYDDTFVLLTPDGRAIELPGSTHPWQTLHEDATDADEDGVGDVGLLRPDEYSASVRPTTKNIRDQPTYHVTTGSGSDEVPGWRDTDHDGIWSDAEKIASGERGDTLTAILFHVGGSDAPAAIGCQVMPADHHARLVDEVAPLGRFNYVLVNVAELPRGI